MPIRVRLRVPGGAPLGEPEPLRLALRAHVDVRPELRCVVLRADRPSARRTRSRSPARRSSPRSSRRSSRATRRAPSRAARDWPRRASWGRGGVLGVARDVVGVEVHAVADLQRRHRMPVDRDHAGSVGVGGVRDAEHAAVDLRRVALLEQELPSTPARGAVRRRRRRRVRGTEVRRLPGDLAAQARSGSQPRGARARPAGASSRSSRRHARRSGAGARSRAPRAPPARRAEPRAWLPPSREGGRRGGSSDPLRPLAGAPAPRSPFAFPLVKRNVTGPPAPAFRLATHALGPQ